MIKLKRLKIDKYRRVAPGTELVFDEGMNVLLGRNGSGKTTLLNLISMCLRSDFSALEREEFAIEYEMVFDGGSRHVRIKNTRDRTRLIPETRGGERRPGAFSEEESFAYEVEISIQEEASGRTFRLVSTAIKGIIEVHSSGTTVHRKEVAPFSPFKPRTILEAHWEAARIPTGDPSGLFMWMHRYPSVYRFDESLQLFGAMVGHSAQGDATGLPSAEMKFDVSSDGKSLGVLSWDLIAREVHSSIIDTLLRSSGFAEVSLPHTQLSFLERYVRETGFLSAELKISVLERSRDTDTTKLRLGGLTFFFTYKDGSGIHHDLLSYGQKRLLAFLYYLDCNQDVVIADELVNGLHHEWIDACIDAIGQRQAFLTSQNPLLLDYLSFESAEQAQRAFIRCHTEELENGRSQMHWANMAKDDAERFYRGYLAGIQHVSEILRTEGLW